MGKKYIHPRAGAADTFAAATATTAYSKGKEVVPRRRVRLCQETSPSSCQEPLHPAALEPCDGRGRGDRGNKGLVRVQFHLYSLCLLLLPALSGICPSYVQRSTPPSSKGSQDWEKGTETVLLASDIRARRGMTMPSLANRHPKEQEHGEQAPLTPETAMSHSKAEEGSSRQLGPVFP